MHPALESLSFQCHNYLHMLSIEILKLKRSF